jgi:hypothetical protein
MRSETTVQSERSQRNSWGPVFHFLGAALVFYSIAVVAIAVSDPYGRLGRRTSRQIPNLSERPWKVSLALDQSFDSAVVGNSASIPMQPEILDRLTGSKFVSLSISGSGAPAALTIAKFFLDHHPTAKTLIVGMDDSWCRTASGMAEGVPFPFWLYDTLPAYFLGLFTNASFDMLRESYLLEARNGFRFDGYHPYDDAFIEHGFNDIDVVLKRLNRAERPTQPIPPVPLPYIFEPPILLERRIAETPSTTFVLFWTPRYITLLPIPVTPADAADKACKKQVAELAMQHSNVRIVDWSEDRPENRDPENFYEANHYRDTLAIKIENEIANALKD